MPPNGVSIQHGLSSAVASCLNPLPFYELFVVGTLQQWSRPWREGPSCRVARWEKAGIVVPRHVTSLSPRSSPPGDGPCEGEIRQICVKIPSVSMLSSPPPRYTTKVGP